MKPIASKSSRSVCIMSTLPSLTALLSGLLVSLTLAASAALEWKEANGAKIPIPPPEHPHKNNGAITRDKTAKINSLFIF